MRTTKPAFEAVILAAVFTVAACGGGGGGGDGDGGFQTPPDGQLSVRLADSPFTDVSEVRLEIDRLRVKPEGERPLLEFDYDPDVSVDLLTVTLDNPLLLLDGEVVRADDYDWIELDVNAEFDGVADSYVIERATGGLFEIEVPGRIVRLVSDFAVTADELTSYIVDWDMRMGLLRPPGQPGYLLRPAFRIIDIADSGTLSGTVATSLITPATPGNQCNADSLAQNPDIGNAVYIFAQGGSPPDDIDGIAEVSDANVDPVATSNVVQDLAGAYRYSTILSPGDYTVAFTCQSGLDFPELDDAILFSGTIDVEITNGEATIANF